MDKAISIIERYLPTLCCPPQLVSKELVSLLNSSGGIICFGVRPNGSVVGIKTTRKDEDVYKCTIDEAVKRIHPMVKPSKYRVSFTPVVDHRGGETKKCVLEIRVEKGDRFQIYETGCDPKVHTLYMHICICKQESVCQNTCIVYYMHIIHVREMKF